MRSDSDTTRHAWLYENIYKKCTSRCDITIFHVSTFLAKYFSTKIIIHKDSLYPDYSVVRNNQPYQSRRYLLRPIARFIAFLHSLSALFFSFSPIENARDTKRSEKVVPASRLNGNTGWSWPTFATRCLFFRAIVSSPRRTMTRAARSLYLRACILGIHDKF